MDTKIAVRTTAVLFVLGLLGLFACRQKELDALPFFQVETEKGIVSPSGSVPFICRIRNDGNGGIDSCGIVWSRSETAVQTLSGPLQVFQRAPASAQDTFMFVFSAPEPGQTYYFRAFAVLGERKVYGIALSYTLGEIAALGEIPPKVSNDSATVWGRLSGLRTLSDGVEAHGFVYSATNPAPELGAADCQFKNLNAAFQDTLFSDTLSGLAFNQRYYFRTYAKVGGRVFHSKKTATFQVKDGWKRLPDFISYQLGSTAVWKEKAYMGFGSRSVASYFSSTLDNTLYQFSQTGGWNTTLPPLEGQFTPKRTEVALFALKDTIYTLTGGNLPDGLTCPAAFTVLDFQKFGVISSSWRKGQNPPILRRIKAVSFVANGKGYVGGGKFFVYDTTVPNANICAYRDSFLSDFWEYTPENGRWRQVASLPYRTSNATQDQTGGRIEAIAFSDGRNGYVGGGVFENLYLRDLWRFVPPANETDPGRWEFVNYLPGLPRTDATAFTIGDRAYFGWGLDPFTGYQSDFWELDLKNPLNWKPRTPCPGPRRGNAYGFGLSGLGYVGGGIDRVWDGFNSFNILHFDFWVYTPEEF